MKNLGLYKRGEEKPDPSIQGDDPFGAGFDPWKMVGWIHQAASKLKTNSEGKRGKVHGMARDVGREVIKELVHTREELSRAETDPKAAFRAGWSLRECLDLLTGWQAGTGKALNANRSAKGSADKRAKHGCKNPFREKVREAYQSYLKERKSDGRKTSKNDFAQWLHREPGFFGMQSDWSKDGSKFISYQGKKVKLSSIRRYV